MTCELQGAQAAATSVALQRHLQLLTQRVNAQHQQLQQHQQRQQQQAR
jgi:hypothetical protein